MDTSGSSRAQGVGVYFHLVIPASGPPRLLLALLVRASGSCVFSGLGCVGHEVRRCRDAGNLDCGIQPPPRIGISLLVPST
jgi:hypothetical protein